MNPGLVAKEVVAAFAAAVLVALTALQDGNVTLGEWIAIAVALLANLLLVHVVKNAQTGALHYFKAIVAGLVAVLTALGAALVDGGWPLTPNEWGTILMALLATFGIVATVPNAAQSDVFVGHRNPPPTPSS